jgi:hypothetical protein
MIVFTALCLAPSARAGDKLRATDLAWLAGCWGAGESYTEQWMKPAGGTLLGMSRTVKGGRTVAHEFIQIREENGDVFYVAKPSGQEGASFKLVSDDPNALVFENPSHDFPQRIIYRLEADGSLMAMVEGMVDGKLRQEKFPMQRVECR